jgi:DNA-binding XRE family transcriptional regulator
MDSLKLQELKSRTTLTSLARAAEISNQQLHNILKQKSLPPLDTARRLASHACRLTKLEIYEPHDFNPTLNPALKNLCDDVRFRITYLDSGRLTDVGTVKELVGEEPDDLELLQAMHECVWDGERRLIHHPDRLIELED